MRNVLIAMTVLSAGAAVAPAADTSISKLPAVVKPAAATKVGGSYKSDFGRIHDRIWLGPELWANPMEDWCVQGGRLECVTGTPNRNVHLLTHQLGKWCGNLAMSVRVGRIDGKTGSAGFLVGVHDNLDDYRGNLFFGKGITAAITTWGTLVLGDKNARLDAKTDLSDVTLRFEARCGSEKDATLILTATDTKSGKRLGSVMTDVKPAALIGNLALANNAPIGQPLAATDRVRNAKADARFWFDDWTVEGSKLDAQPDHAFGPILFSMYTLNHSRGDDGYVMKMTAQLPPVGAGDAQIVRLETRQGGDWKSLGHERVDPDARTATFRIPNWPGDRDVPYRLVYTQKFKGAPDKDVYWTGTVRKDPVDHPLVVAGFTGHFHTGYPYAPLVANVAKLNPDVLFYSGDQIYESSGGYGIIREPADRAILSYLRKWYMFGWAWADLLRDRPAICLPDDHDVFQGNIWGEGGKKMAGRSPSSSGGYIEPVRMVNMVHRVNTAHMPDPYDPKPILQDITVYYGDWVYGRTSFAILADRMFKSGPENVDTGGGRADWVKGPGFDVKKLDKPGLKLLGRRQLKVLDHWAGDWRGADMKMVLSQTVFANVATHHGGHDNYLQADLDSGGWPQSGRNRAIRAMRKGYPLHYNGDQHLPTLVQYGVDQPRDSCWSFCTPSVTVGYQRWWRPDDVNMPHTDRPAQNLPNTGEYHDGLGNLVYVYAVANPKGGGAGAADRYHWADAKSSGFAVVTVNHDKRTYTCDCYHFLADLSGPKSKSEFAGWPFTIRQRENYGRAVTGYLPEVSIAGVKNAVLQVYNAKTGELVYAIRLQGNKVRPWVFEDGTYNVRLGDPDAGKWETFKDLKPTKG